MKALLIGNKNEKRTKRGSSILEVLIATAVLTLSISAVIMLSFANQSLKVDTDTSGEALLKAQKVLEDARAASRQDLSSVAGYTDTSDPYYTNELLVLDEEQCKKVVVGRTSWTIPPARPEKIELTTALGDIKTAVALGGDCISEPPDSDWDNPTSFASDNFNPGKPTSIDVLNKIAYIGGDKTPFLFIADATHATAGQSSGLFITFANGFDAGSKINSIDVAAWHDPATGLTRYYAYAAMDTTTNQLEVIDVTDIHNPVLVATRALAACVGNSYPQGYRLYYYKNRLYFVTRETAGPEFHIFDVTTPVNPTELGSGACRGTELTTTINNMIVRDQLVGGSLRRFAYVADTRDSGELAVYDVTDPANIGAISEVVAARQNLPGAQDGKSIYLIGNKIYFGRQSTPGGPDLYVYDATDPTTGLPLLGSQDINTGVIGLRVAGRFAFIGTPKTNSEFQVWNISNLVNITNIATFNFPNIIENGMDYEPDFVYATAVGNDALRIIYSP